MIGVLIADDHPMVRGGLEAMLESEGDFSIAALASNGEEALALAKEKRPDVILSDVRMPKMDGFALLAGIKEAGLPSRVLLLAGMPLTEEESRAMSEGAAGYLPKDVDQDKISDSIRKISSDPAYFAREEFHQAPSPLTAREMDVLRLVSQGNQRDKIASSLGIGAESVKTHLKGIMTKLSCPNATAAVRRAYELGIMKP